jgi:hypothetical protein
MPDRKDEKLKLGKGAAFVKSRLKHLPQDGDTWKADFRALPKPMMQSETHYLGLVVERLAKSDIIPTERPTWRA